MNILGQVAVYPKPDERIKRLTELAYNLWWSWRPDAWTLYSEIDRTLWEHVDHNPVAFLRQVSQQALDRAAGDPAYIAHYAAVMQAFDGYLHPDTTWYDTTFRDPERQLIAYFSAEFGLHESLPIYSGGLGILSGDHCKAASDLGLPFVGVGFLYPQGYFQQRIDADGHQQAIYEKLNFADVPATPALDAAGREIMVSVDLPGRTIYAKVWCIQVGRVPVYLMDTDVERNAPADRELSARLYGGDQEIRISQEVVLGIGGVRVLRALGLHPTVWHMNEGHAAFLQLERIREYVQEKGLDFLSALWAARSDALFTTHTPVPAGNDAFPPALMDRFFSNFWGQMGLDRDGFLAIGSYDYSWGPQFSMTVLALRTAGRANGVSELHGEVSRRMWRSLWPGVPLPEIPIGHVTNGVHTDSWLSPELGQLYERYLGPTWRSRLDNPAAWSGVKQIPEAELWEAHNKAKRDLVTMLRERVVGQLVRNGGQPAQINAAAKMFDPNILTIGFARRFATYKRAMLIFRDQERLRRILFNPERPVQLVFAGKAHPADEPGKGLIQFVYQMSQRPEFAGRIVFVEDYDINLARHLVSGVDVWLNNPRRPLEASGTSGQKAGLNGVPNLSVLDGWWVEGYDGHNGWAIGSERAYADEAAQDEADALSLYHLLEDEVVPLFYERNEHGIPEGWLAKMCASISTVGPQFSFSRMLKEYVNRYYVPAGVQGQQVLADNALGARSLAGWERRVREIWPAVGVTARPAAECELRVREPANVDAALQGPPNAAGDLAVELVYGREAQGELASATVIPMAHAGEDSTYRGALTSPNSGQFVYAVRVRPEHPHLPNPFALPLVKWA